MSEDKYNVLIKRAINDGILDFERDRIMYKYLSKNYNYKYPEEIVRANIYVELIYSYKYKKELIDLEVIVPRREPYDKADIVVFEDEALKKTYVVIEVKRDGISQSEIKQGIEQLFGNANSLRSRYASFIAGNIRLNYDVYNYPPQEREKNIIADIPVNFGKVIKYRYKKGDLERDLRIVTKDELLNKFQQCHDTLWEGGKRNPAEAFDEMSKLMFCKIHDERFLTKKNGYYKFQIGTYESIKVIAERVKKIYEDAHIIDPSVFQEPIKVEDPIIHSVVEILQGISLHKTELDAKGVAFEHFLSAVFRGDMGQYFTPREIVEFMVEFLQPTERDWIIDPACGSGGFLIYAMDNIKKELEEKLDAQDAYDRWYNFAKYQLYGIEINSQLSRVAMLNMIIHGDGHTNIENNDALEDIEKFDLRRNITLGKYNIVITNPPFGAVIKTSEKNYLKNYLLGSKSIKRRRQNTEILFIERCLDLLKPDGKLGIILPEGILTNSTLRYVREYIIKNAQILAVISLPKHAFSFYGAGVKTSILFLRKFSEDEVRDNYPIFMSIVEHIGYDATGKDDINELPLILNKWWDFNK